MTPPPELTMHSFSLNYLTKVCSLRANLFATWTHEGYLLCEFSWFGLSLVLQQWWIPFQLLSSPKWTLREVLGGFTLLWRWTPHAIKKTTCYIKHHQNESYFINFFSLVDIHGIYYIVKNGNQIWWFMFFKIWMFLTRMMHNWNILSMVMYM